MSIPHLGMSRNRRFIRPDDTLVSPWIPNEWIRTHGLPDDAFVSPEHSDAPELSQSQTEPNSEEVEEATPQGSEVSNTNPFSPCSH